MIRRERVLLAWENGRNLGHAARLLAVADELTRCGAEVIWAVPAHELHTPTLAPTVGARVAAPLIAFDRVSSDTGVHSFADILIALGFADADALQSAVSAWLALFDRQAIDRVVLDYAPAAQLAASIAQLPAAQITNGFEAPPPRCPLFGIGMRGPMLERRNAQRLEAIDRSIGLVSHRLGRSGQTNLAEVFAYPARWYDCIAETDPYGPRDDGAYVGPVGHLGSRTPAQWPAGPAQASKVFVYLRSEHQLAAVLGALPAASCRVVCVWPGAPETLEHRLQRDDVSVVTTPINLDALLPECDLVVTYGSVATVCKALLHGKPQLMLPTEVDKHLVASRVVAIGAGRVLGPRASRSELRGAVTDLLESADAATAARAVAARYAGGLDGLTRVCEAFMKGSAPAPKAVPCAAKNQRDGGGAFRCAIECLGAR